MNATPSRTTRITSQAIDGARLMALHAGAPTRTLIESFALDFAPLMQQSVPQAGTTAITAMHAAAGLGVVKRMARAGEILYAALGSAGFEVLRLHPSDTVRGWACYVLAIIPNLSIDHYLQSIRPLADDAHFGVREWAWLAMRPLLVAELSSSLEKLQAWTAEPSPNLRRFACEVLRPRGVWCTHITALKANPESGLPLLEALRADEHRYVQDSVANWLNDASKHHPDWVRALCQRWLDQSQCAATQRICRRAQRSLAARPVQAIKPC